MAVVKPMISLIAAMADNRVIGIENRLPWKLPADMKWFRQHTLGKPIVMGRKTFESFGSKPLPQRSNIVVTHDPDYQAAAATVVHSIDEAIAAAGDVDEIMIIGGASFYAQLLPRAQRLYLTYVDSQVNGDAWFPEVDARQWQTLQQSEHPADEKNVQDMRFVIMQRKSDHV